MRFLGQMILPLDVVGHHSPFKAYRDIRIEHWSQESTGDKNWMILESKTFSLKG